MDLGLIDLMLNVMNGAILQGLTNLQPLAFLFLAASLLVGAAMGAIVMIWQHPMTYLWLAMKLVLANAIVSIVILSWGTYSNVLADTSVVAGLAIAGNQITVAEFMNPGRFAWRASRISEPFIQYVDALGFEAYYRPDLLIGMILASIVVGGLWMFMAMLIVFAIWAYKIITLLAFVMLGFLVASSTRWVGMNGIRLLVAASVALFTIAAWTSILILIIPLLTLDVAATRSLQRQILLCVISTSLFVVTMTLPLVTAGGAFSMAGAQRVQQALSRVSPS